MLAYKNVSISSDLKKIRQELGMGQEASLIAKLSF
jgi:hypothetical protein